MNASILLAVLMGTCALLSTSTAIPPGESCQGRCGESFRRGQVCECDPNCTRFGTCCYDYQNHCAPPRSDRKSTSDRKSEEERWSSKPLNSESEEASPDSSSPLSPYRYPYKESPLTPDLSPLTPDLSPLTPDLHPLMDSSSGPASSAPSTNPGSVMEALGDASAPDAPLPSQGGPSAGNTGPQNTSSPRGPLNIQIALSSPQAPGSPGSKPAPGTLEQLAQALAGSSGSELAPGTLEQLAQALAGSKPAPGTLEQLAQALAGSKPAPGTLEQLAQALAGSKPAPSTLEQLAQALAGSKPAPSTLEQLAQALAGSSGSKLAPSTLEKLAQALTGSSGSKPERGTLEKLAQALTGSSGSKPEPGTLEKLAQALAGSKPAPGTLEQLAQALAGSSGSKPASGTLEQLAQALAGSKPAPRTLEELAQALAGSSGSELAPSTLEKLAQALTGSSGSKPEPGTLEQLAQALAGSSGSKPASSTLEQLAQALAGSKPAPGTLEKLAQALGRTDSQASGPGASSLPDLCSDQSINGLTVLNNGSILVFKGEFFWLVDPSTRRASPARSISDHLGLPSPIDTVFTRCNCKGNTYVIKGDQYWRLDDGVVEPGYPQPLSSGFSGLTGSITAALAVPATKKRPEAVYFFKKGGKMQKFSFPTGSGPSCNWKSPARSRTTRQTEGRLSLEINIQVSLKGLPAPVTSALSVPNPKKPDGYDYFLFSGPLFFNIKISGDLLSLVKPPRRGVAGATRQNQNSVSSWLKCP
ncbi:proteoglycan 4a isoform X1 [Osmerus eperlanus]|uniref:proteoglycan 4a isoform X1 n=1 Tax=Osmerus eperlanus TaxID=29151 RepID=UPI002E0D60CE